MSGSVELLNAEKDRLSAKLNDLLDKPHVIKAFKLMGQIMEVMSAIEKLQSFDDEDSERKSEVIAKSKMARILTTQAKKIE